MFLLMSAGENEDLGTRIFVLNDLYSNMSRGPKTKEAQDLTIPKVGKFYGPVANGSPAWSQKKGPRWRPEAKPIKNPQRQSRPALLFYHNFPFSSRARTKKGDSPPSNAAAWPS